MIEDLSPLEYDQAEGQAFLVMPNRVIEACQTVTFDRYGYPTRVRSESELFRFVEATGETLFEERFEKLLGGLSEDELCFWKRVWWASADFTSKKFGQPVIPLSTLAAGHNVLRHLRYLFPHQKPRIFEAGPGSGHFAALLLHEGYPYAAIDITQALYLFQSHYWNHLTNGNLQELAYGGDTSRVLGNVSSGAPVHVPWWEYMKVVGKEHMPQFDVMICNHALCEMHDHSLRYHLVFAREILKGAQQSRKAFIFEGWGNSTMADRERTIRLFHHFGFRMVHHDLLITVFVPESSPDAEHSCQYPDPERGGYPCISYQSDKNSISRSIIEGRQALQREWVIDFKRVIEEADEMVGTSDHRTDDERFWGLIGMRSRVLPGHID